MKVRKISYWCCTQHYDSQCFNIRARTRKEAKAKAASNDHTVYSKPFKVTIVYKDAFDLMSQCLGEGSIDESKK